MPHRVPLSRETRCYLVACLALLAIATTARADDRVGRAHVDARPDGGRSPPVAIAAATSARPSFGFPLPFLVGQHEQRMARQRGFSTSWSWADHAWLERNRRFAMVGKILTVVGRVATFGVLTSGRVRSPYWTMMTVAGAGELMWSGSDLRATNELRARGFRLRKGAAVASVVGAVVFAPLTWVLGPIQSSRIRGVGATLEEPPFAQVPSASATAPGGLVMTF